MYLRNRIPPHRVGAGSSEEELKNRLSLEELESYDEVYAFPTASKQITPDNPTSVNIFCSSDGYLEKHIVSKTSNLVSFVWHFSGNYLFDRRQSRLCC